MICKRWSFCASEKHYKAESGCETGFFACLHLIAVRISSLAQPFGQRSSYWQGGLGSVTIQTQSLGPMPQARWAGPSWGG